MATKKAKKTTKKKRPASATATSIMQAENAPQQSGKKQFSAIIMFAAAVFFMFVAIISSEEKNLWNWLHDFMFGVFGVCAYIMPIILGAVAVLGAMDKYSDKYAARIVEGGLLVWFICGAVDIFSGIAKTTEFLDHFVTAFKFTDVYGGVLGALLGHPMHALLGATGAKITIILLIIVVLMFITGTTLISAYKMLAKPIKSAGAAIENRLEEHEKRREEQKAKFELDVAVPGEKRGPTVEEVTDKPLNVAEQRRKVIATYRGEEYTPETQIDVEVEPQDEPVEPLKKQVKLPVEETTKKEVQTEEKPENDAPMLDGISNEVTLEDIPEDEDAYRFPPLSLLQEPSGVGGAATDHEAVGEQLVEILRSFGVETKIINISVGPSVTRYELQPAAGVKISKITGLSNDIAMNLAAAGVRIEAPIPNKPAVGIEVPNKSASMVTVREIIDSKAFTSSKSKLTVALGRDIAGTPIVTDIAKMPHGLIAGATGSGKSVCINSFIVSLLYNANPDEVKLLMIDPKVVELGVYNGIPHLLVPVVTDPRKAAGALGWAVQEMEKRYRLFAECNVRNLEGYNHLAEMSEDLPKMPHIVIIIDELADLMATSSKEVEDYIARITAKARAAGMHLIVATQRPSVDVVTGVIKNNIPTRIAFAVSSQTDSRTIIDMGGAERLLGKGDMLYCPFGANKPTRVQGCFVSEEEVERVVDFIKNGQTCEYDETINDEIERMATINSKDKGAARGDEGSSDDRDPMIYQAIECVIDAGRASASHLQSRLKLGYARASRIINEMEEMGVIGPYEGAKPRQVLITKTEFLEMQARQSGEE